MDFVRKGWRNERVIDMHPLERGHVILVLNGDPPAHTNKVQEVIGMMEMELEDNAWLLRLKRTLGILKMPKMATTQTLEDNAWLLHLKRTLGILKMPKMATTQTLE
ncbi:hypothetical protein Ccrd_025561 [Cynara cardunculus var. scolymus]|uniref:Uncharacterized protein n=1 Tax=Cynara cardunculus var. scolymus TaxID=59895 RepID=A0A124S6I1_CYNCS|nr:hypothetical protein Ccrd_025561 [Cynara cardunculus var. scolymus]